MSGTEASSATNKTSDPGVDMNLEIQIIPVSDIDRAKRFYEQLGWRLDDDVAPFDGLRVVQFTPPGLGAASITFGKGLTTSAPGSAGGGLVVSDIKTAHDGLAERGNRRERHLARSGVPRGGAATRPRS